MREGPSGKRFDEQWREIPDDTPVSVSVNLRPKSMEQMVALYVAQAMSLQQKMNGEETSEEAEDLDVDEEGDSEILTPYELHALAAEAEREARRKEWLLQQIRGRSKKEPGDDKGRADASAGSGDRAGEKAASGVGGNGSNGAGKGEGVAPGEKTGSGSGEGKTGST